MSFQASLNQTNTDWQHSILEMIERKRQSRDSGWSQSKPEYFYVENY